MSFIFSYFQGSDSQPKEQEVDTDRVIPLPTEEEIPSPIEVGNGIKDRSIMLDEMLHSQKVHNRNLRLALSDSFFGRASLLDSYATYHRVTWGIITVIPIINTLVRQDVGVVISILSFVTLLIISEMDIMTDGHEIAQQYRKTALNLRKNNQKYTTVEYSTPENSESEDPEDLIYQNGGCSSDEHQDD